MLQFNKLRVLRPERSTAFNKPKQDKKIFKLLSVFIEILSRINNNNNNKYLIYNQEFTKIKTAVVSGKTKENKQQHQKIKKEQNHAVGM